MRSVLFFAAVVFLVAADLVFAQTLGGTGLCNALTRAIQVAPAVQILGTGIILIAGLGIGAGFVFRDRIPTGLIIGGLSVFFAVMFYYVAPLLRDGLEKIRIAACG